jgi:hypothetical protein
MIALRESDATYRTNIRAAVRALWNGVWGQAEFLDQMLLAFRYELPRAWAEGAKQCGVMPADYTDEEKAELDRIISYEFNYAINFAAYIATHDRAHKFKFTPLFNRVDKWVLRRLEVVNKARLMACADKPMIWRVGPTKNHCVDCAWYNGKVYRGSVWAKYGISPQNRCLACHGYGSCTLEPTTLPITRGRPKRMSGC